MWLPRACDVRAVISLPSQGDVLTEVTGRLVKADLVSYQGNPLIRLREEVAAELRRDQ